MPITPTTVRDTTVLRMNVAALYVLRDEGWDDRSLDPTGSFHAEQIDDDVVLVTVRTTNCQSVDLVEAARHCLHLHDVDEVIEVVTHDGSAS